VQEHLANEQMDRQAENIIFFGGGHTIITTIAMTELISTDNSIIQL